MSGPVTFAEFLAQRYGVKSALALDDDEAYSLFDGLVREDELVGQRVVLSHLLHEGTFPGEIVEWSGWPRTCVVKLDCQDEPVAHVRWYPEEPTGEIPAYWWQVCWPEEAGG